MTIDEISSRIKEIVRNENDLEIVHSLEDALVWEFVDHVERTGSDELVEMAKRIQTSRKIAGGHRWFA